ncbi:MFS transporter [Kitasatospora kifunensis]|uniref:MFS family permease n=1 Tax=Kitasatospora kifunensis TaxID=58351 RepID=A0A7W7R5Q4_KITKI|nr:MFS transporter [Kitasatospora kifunensis]MBB4925893.1 MFS family permease [Kitasatospora kifunensis]
MDRSQQVELSAPDRTEAAPRADRRFNTFWMGQSVSQFGDRISELALPLIAVAMLHADAQQTALLTALIWLPNTVAPVVGAWVDSRTHKRVLLIAADVLRAVALLSLPVAYAAHGLGLAQLYLVGAITGVGQTLFDVSYPTFFTTLIPRSGYVAANSKLSTSRSASFVIGPAIGGALIQAVTAPVAVAVDAVSFLFSATMISRIRTPETPPASDAHLPLRTRMAVGARFVFGHAILRASLACSATMNFFMLAAQAIIILFASRVLGLSAGAIGLALGAGAVGGLIGAVVARKVIDVVGLGRTIMLGAVFYPSPLALLTVAGGAHWKSAVVFGVAEFLSGMAVMFFDIANNSLRAAVTPDNLRSRISGAYSAINYGCRPLGALVGGWLGTGIGMRPTLLTAGIGGALGVLCLLPSPIPGIKAVPESVNKS